MTGKVSGSQVPGSPEGEKQGWPVKGFRPALAGGRMTLTRLFLPFGRLQKEGLRRPETKKNKK